MLRAVEQVNADHDSAMVVEQHKYYFLLLENIKKIIPELVIFAHLLFNLKILAIRMVQEFMVCSYHIILSIFLFS